jgi:uncharacterized protein YdeI (YjbR/CyaY-like superfamily)
MNPLRIPQVDVFLEEASKWQKEMAELRDLVLACGLTEEWKWSNPCYTYQGGNVLMISSLKDCCVLSFFKGVLIDDVAGILQKPGENSQSGRIIRFTEISQIKEIATLLKTYIFQSIEIEKAGLQVDFSAKNQLEFPEELKQKWDEKPELKNAFLALPPGKQRGYVLYFTGAKQSSSRSDRIVKYIPRILSGKGFHDCVCGLSKKYPTCDGSHKNLGR